MKIGVVWPTRHTESIRGGLLDKIRDEAQITHIRLNLSHLNPNVPDLVHDALNAGFTVLPILETDYKQPDIPAFCDFAEQVMEWFHFPIVEILNEPKTMEGMKPWTYHDIATAVAERLQKYRPALRIAAAGDFIQFDRRGPRLDHWLKFATLDPKLFDLIAVHPYREPGKPTVTRFGTRCKEYEAYRKHLGGLPCIVTEVNWNLAEVSEQQQADYLYEELCINRDCGIEATYIYSMVSEGAADAPERNNGMGLFRGEDWSARPAVDSVVRFQQEQAAA